MNIMLPFDGDRSSGDKKMLIIKHLLVRDEYNWTTAHLTLNINELSKIYNNVYILVLL
jgi:hypothetical protein